MKLKLFFIFLLPVLFLALPAKAEVGHCLCNDKCTEYTYTTAAEQSDAELACKAPACGSSWGFLVGNCKTYVGSCICSGTCKEYSYSNQTDWNNLSTECKKNNCSIPVGTGCVKEDGKKAGDSGSGSSGGSSSGGGTFVPQKPVSLENPLASGTTDVNVIIGTVIKGVLGVMGGVMLLMLVWGGSTWLIAAGNPEKIKSGTQTILWAIIGAVITLSSYVILKVILGFLSS